MLCDNGEKCEEKSKIGMIPEEKRGAFLCPWSRKTEVIRCFELALNQSRENRTKKKWSTDVSVSPSVCIS